MNDRCKNLDKKVFRIKEEEDETFVRIVAAKEDLPVYEIAAQPLIFLREQLEKKIGRVLDGEAVVVSHPLWKEKQKQRMKNFLKLGGLKV